MRIHSAEQFESLRKDILGRRDPQAAVALVCAGTGCLTNGSAAVAEALQEVLAKKGNNSKVVLLKKTGCHGFCEKGPLVSLRPSGIFYTRVKPEDAEEIVERTILKGEVIDRLLYVDTKTGEPVRSEEDIPFYQRQLRIALRNIGQIAPGDIEDYIVSGGYSALTKALTTMTSEQVLEEVERANLRGRGGGGFPAGRKWRSCKIAEGDTRYVVCNGDEGDPGAFMDRSIMEGDPHSVLEGMTIAAYAIGAPEGYVYVRLEYPLAVEHLEEAIVQAREQGFLGENILGSGFNFDIHIARGGGAFVCGESSALMISLMGRAGEPRAKYVHTTDRGLWDKPTNLNNVETYANVPEIINRGAEWFQGIGTEGSKGTKVFSLVGKVKNTGLVEVPMGITLREIVFDIGGGIPGDRKFKAVQTGGPSGGCIPSEMLDLEVDFDKLTEVGSMMGSGGMIVMDETDCMVDVAWYFQKFLEEESCGKCIPCREGVRRMREILERICHGDGRPGDIELLEELAATVADGSLCQLGGSAPNPVLTTLKYFRHEYEAHIKDKTCPAKVCRSLLTYSVIDDKCTGCRICAQECPEGAISGEKKEPHLIDQDKCVKCGICYEVCKFAAVNMV